MMRSHPLRRCLCCFLALLVLCMAVVKPIQVRAVDSVTAAVVGIPAAIALSSLMIGSGLLPGTDSSAFETLVGTILETLDPVFTFVNEAGVTCLKMIRLANSVYAQKELVDSVISAIVTSDAISTNISSNYTGTLQVADAEYSFSEYFSCFIDAYYAFDWSSTSMSSFQPCYVYYAYSSSQIVFGFFQNEPTYFNGSQVNFTKGIVTASFRFNTTQGLNVDGFGTYAGSDYGRSFCPSAISYGPVDFNSVYLPFSDSYVIGNLAESLAAPTYEEWRKTQIIEFPSSGSDGDGDEESEGNSYIGVGIAGATTAYVYAATQAYVQSGVSTGDLSDILVETGEVVEIQADTSTDTDTDADTNPDTSTAPSVDPAGFQLDLTQFFPFCIPFDLYKMLACLAAEPEAPKFTFAIPKGLDGIYEFEVDLSAWDNTAAMVRRLEVVLFIIGLTVATRKFIKW